MRRQDTWLNLADRLRLPATVVVSVCVFLNLRRRPSWIARQLRVQIETVERIAEAAKPLLRQSRRRQEEKVCHYCGGDEDVGIDHVIPRSRGGGDEPENLVPCCRNCNSAKGDRTPEEWLTNKGQRP